MEPSWEKFPLAWLWTSSGGRSRLEDELDLSDTGGLGLDFYNDNSDLRALSEPGRELIINLIIAIFVHENNNIIILHLVKFEFYKSPFRQFWKRLIANFFDYIFFIFLRKSLHQYEGFVVAEVLL